MAMWLLNDITSSARAALAYITIGALMIVWAAIYYVYLNNNHPEGTSQYYWCAGFLLSGVVLLAIGLGVGWIGRAARPANQQAIIAPTAQAPTNRPQAAAPAQAAVNNPVVVGGSTQPVVVSPPSK